MPGRLQAWYGFPELAALGDRGVELTDNLELAELTRLRSWLHADEGRQVAVRIRMGRGPRDRLTMALEFKVSLGLVCQRCLEPMEFLVDENVQWVVLESESERAVIDADADVIVLSDERVRFANLIEDELIVSLPLVPRHASIDECGALAQNLKAVLIQQGSEQTGPTLKV